MTVLTTHTGPPGHHAASVAVLASFLAVVSVTTVSPVLTVSVMSLCKPSAKPLTKVSPSGPTGLPAAPLATAGSCLVNDRTFAAPKSTNKPSPATSTPAPGPPGLSGRHAAQLAEAATPSALGFTAAVANARNRQCVAIFTLDHTASGPTGPTVPPLATEEPVSALVLTIVDSPTMFNQLLAVPSEATLPGPSGLTAPAVTNSATNPSPQVAPDSKFAQAKLKSRTKHVLLHAAPTGPPGEVGHHVRPAAAVAS